MLMPRLRLSICFMKQLKNVNVGVHLFFFVFQSPASNSKIAGWFFGWYHSSHADLSSGHGAS